MPSPSIARIRNLIRSLKYVVSLHGAEKMEDDYITVLDLENTILAGHIVERQKDQETDETKTVIRGRTFDGREAEVVVKISASGVLYIITLYLV
ncbi:MAG: DUF4258 domain-containing protein [Betaproteobacteria bacterium]